MIFFSFPSESSLPSLGDTIKYNDGRITRDFVLVEQPVICEELQVRPYVAKAVHKWAFGVIEKHFYFTIKK